MNKETDILLTNEMLTPEQRLIAESVRKFVDSKILPDIEKHFEEGTFPDELPKQLGEMGLLGGFVPEEYGGSGSDYTTYGLVCRELERGDSGVRSFCSVQSSLVMFPIWKFGSEDQKKKWLPQLAKGKAIGCFGLTEPNHGSDPGSMLTTLREDGEGGYILNGAKMWITNSPIADIAVVWGRVENGPIKGVIVEKGMAGFSAPVIKGKWSLRASITGELVFENADFQPNDPAFGWDGFYKGKKMNPAVFVYYAEVEFIDGVVELYKGDVTILK